MQRTIFFKVLLLCSAVTTLCMVAMWLSIQVFAPARLVRELSVEARDVAIEASRSVDGVRVATLLDAIRDAEPTRETLTEYLEELAQRSPEEARDLLHDLTIQGVAGEFEQILVLPERMRSVRADLEKQMVSLHRGYQGRGVGNLYLVGQIGERRYVLAASSASDGLLVFEVPEDEVYPDLVSALAAKLPRAGSRYVQSDWGNFVSGFAPVDMPGGRSVVMEVDFHVPDLGLVQRIFTSNLYLALLPGLGAALAGSLLFTWGHRRRIRALEAGLGNLRAGKFGDEIEVTGKDEIARVAESVNGLARALRTRESALERAVSRTVATELLAGRLREEGELREATVLFSDIRGFTAMSEALPAAEVVAILNAYFDVVAPIIEANGGIVDKFLGDGMLAVFGAPIGLRNDALAAARAAAEIRSALVSFNAGRSRPIEVGIGISTGPLVAGSVGSSERRNYTVLGHTVNVGARLCAQASSGQILLGETTFLRARDEMNATEIAPLTLKGVTFQVRAFELLSVKN